MNGYLLDTHALVWWWRGDTMLPPNIRSLIERGERKIYVSAVTPFEMATKHRVGKWPEVEDLLPGFEETMVRSGLIGLPILFAHARLAGSLASPHRDPFDRLLAAQAIMESLMLISADSAFAGFGLSTVWRQDVLN